MAAASSPVGLAPQTIPVESSVVPILAMGGGITLIGVIRNFARAGVPLYAVCSKTDLATHSRWYRELPSAGSDEVRPSQLASFLRRLSLGRAVLMPCGDDWLQAVADLPDSLVERFPSSMAPASTIRSMVDKWQFAKLLEALSIPHPDTILITSYEHLASLQAHKFRNKILKPLSSIEFASTHKVKGYLVADQAEALGYASLIDFPIMLQEYIPGPPRAHFFVDGFVDRTRQVCARLARQRLRMYPPKLGNSSLMISIPLAEIADAIESVERLLIHTRYRGIFSAEFKYDHRDGHFKLLEINARPWWYVEFAARCGVDVCLLAYRDALGLPIEPVYGYQTGRRCVLMVQDFLAYCGLRGVGPSFWSWIYSCAHADGALLEASDPRPAITYVCGSLKSALRKQGKRLLH